MTAAYTVLPSSDNDPNRQEELHEAHEPPNAPSGDDTQTFQFATFTGSPTPTSPPLETASFLRRRSSLQAHLPHTSLQIQSNPGATTRDDSLSFLSPRRPLRLFLIISTLTLISILYATKAHQNMNIHLPSFDLTSVTSNLKLPFYKASPPATCDTCRLDPKDPLCRYGGDNVRLSRMYEGSGYRVRRVIEKALRGERISISLIGGSVTAGHGVPPGELKWHEVFTNDWIKLFPNTTIYDGSYPGMGSQSCLGSWRSGQLEAEQDISTGEFFSYCFEEQVPPTSDLYLVELDINNPNQESTYHHDDALYRGLLQLPQHPAVVRISVYSMQFDDLQEGTPSALTMSSYFDIPMIGLKNFMLPHILLHPDLVGDLFENEGGGFNTRHIGYVQHRILGDMLALYFREQVCNTKDQEAQPSLPKDSLWPGEEILDSIPDQYLWTKWLPESHAHMTSHTCSLFGSKWHPLQLPPSTSPAWQITRWNGKAAVASFEVGSQIVLPFSGVSIGIFVWTVSGEKNDVKPGRALCWVDDSRDGGKVVDAYWNGDVGYSLWHMLEENLAEGDHTLTCEILAESSTEGHDFRILGIGSR
ncbi:hypothetical protein P7C70_g99, partial [Phenoliferia sp. Uapishka_3]